MDAAPQANATLQEIIDHHEIRKLLSAYCHGCDRGDWGRMGSVYAEDSFDDHGDYKGSGAAFPSHIAKAYDTGAIQCSHLLGQSQITVDGDRAGAETYFIASIYGQPHRETDVVSVLGGRYVDTLTRGPGGWKIDKRVCVRDWSATLDATQDSLRKQDFVRGLLTGQDVSYAALGLKHSAG
jgi:hypothetical protein